MKSLFNETLNIFMSSN